MSLPEGVLYVVFFVIWIYTSICLFMVSINNFHFYIKNIPMMDKKGTYQIKNFIPLFIFTNYFDKKEYIERLPMEELHELS